MTTVFVKIILYFIVQIILIVDMSLNVKPIIENNTERFVTNEFTDSLLSHIKQLIINFDMEPKIRINLDDIAKHKWFTTNHGKLKSLSRKISEINDDESTDNQM